MSLAAQVWLVGIVLAASAAVLAYLLARILGQLRRARHDPVDPTQQLLQHQIEALREQVRASLEGGRLEIDRRLEETNRVVGEVRRGLGEVDRQVRSVGEATRDLRGLQELLRSPTARGGVGEYLLNDLLSQVLPQAHYTLQHEFPGGERVDSVLRLGDGLVPVDAKFPLENFRKLRQAARESNEERAARRSFRADVRRHIDNIGRRYIRPDDGTYDFAMMYIPSEAVYQEVIHQEGDDGLDLFHYALSQKVVPVSPQSFYAYLQVILLGLRGMSIESRAREIMDRLGGVRHRLDRFVESFDIVARHLGNAQSQMREAGSRLARVDAAITELPGDKAGESSLDTERGTDLGPVPGGRPSGAALDN